MNTGKIFARLRLIRKNTASGGGMRRIRLNTGLCVWVLGKLGHLNTGFWVGQYQWYPWCHCLMVVKSKQNLIDGGQLGKQYV